MEIYFVRHGETDWNKERRIQGTTDISLNAFGKHLAKETGEGLRNIRFDLNISSPLVRTLQTADLILEGRSIERITDERLIEMRFGELEGRKMTSNLGELPEMLQNFNMHPERYVAPTDGEDFAQVLERTGAFLEDLYHRPEYQDKKILVTTHGVALAGILCNIKKIPVDRFWEAGVHKNCAVTLVKVTEGTPEIVYENHTYYKDHVEDWFANMVE